MAATARSFTLVIPKAFSARAMPIAVLGRRSPVRAGYEAAREAEQARCARIVTARIAAS